MIKNLINKLPATGNDSQLSKSNTVAILGIVK